MAHSLIEFVEARLRERAEAAEKALGGGSGVWTNYGDDVGEGPNSPMVERVTTGEALDHIALNDPAWVLADVAVKRASLTEHAHEAVGIPEISDDDPGYCRTCYDERYPSSGGETAPENAYPCQTMRLLASLWSGHPGYDEAWRPDLPSGARA